MSFHDLTNRLQIVRLAPDAQNLLTQQQQCLRCAPAKISLREPCLSLSAFPSPSSFFPGHRNGTLAPQIHPSQNKFPSSHSTIGSCCWPRMPLPLEALQASSLRPIPSSFSHLRCGGPGISPLPDHFTRNNLWVI